MSDPKRWRETEGAEIAGLLSELSNVQPSQELREGVWAKIAPTLPSGPGSGSPSGSGGGSGAGPGAKVMAPAIAAAGVASAVVIWLMATSSPTPRASETTIDTPRMPAVSSVSVAPSRPAARVEVREPDAVAAAPSVERPQAIPKASRDVVTASSSTAAPATAPSAPIAAADRLREEAEGVRNVRQLLREGRAPAALAELDRLAKLVPNGPLEEEREVLTIEALAASGATEAARRRADRFLFERSQSVHAARVRALAGH